MTFDTIGPYRLTRADLFWASLIISFRLGSRGTLLTCYSLAAALIVLIVIGLLSSDYVIVALAAFWLTWLFMIGLALRSLKRSQDIYMSFDPEGIVAETPTTRTIYKWSTMDRAACVGSRLFLMVTGRCALVVAERYTSRANLEAIIATVDAHRRAGSA